MNWLRADLHVHTCHSRQSGDFDLHPSGQNAFSVLRNGATGVTSTPI